jgi:hypothetical protein
MRADLAALFRVSVHLLLQQFCDKLSTEFEEWESRDPCFFLPESIRGRHSGHIELLQMCQGAMREELGDHIV